MHNTTGAMWVLCGNGNKGSLLYCSYANFFPTGYLPGLCIQSGASMLSLRQRIYTLFLVSRPIPHTCSILTPHQGQSSLGHQPLPHPPGLLHLADHRRQSGPPLFHAPPRCCHSADVDGEPRLGTPPCLHHDGRAQHSDIWSPSDVHHFCRFHSFLYGGWNSSSRGHGGGLGGMSFRVCSPCGGYGIHRRDRDHGGCSVYRHRHGCIWMAIFCYGGGEKSETHILMAYTGAHGGNGLSEMFLEALRSGGGCCGRRVCYPQSSCGASRSALATVNS